MLVYECHTDELELVGFEDVEDREDLHSALAARGHDVGTIHHEPVRDGETGRWPSRSVRQRSPVRS